MCYKARVPPRAPSTALLIAMTTVSSFSISVLIPSLPGIARGFGVAASEAQLAHTLFLAGVAVGQLFYGPISDRFGRRPPLLIGLAITFSGALAALLASSFNVLLLARGVQALGACSGLVMGRAMVRDSATRDRAASMIGYITMAQSLAVVMAPTIGGQVAQRFGWRGVFVIMSTFALLVFVWAVARANETLLHRHETFQLRAVVRADLRLLCTRRFLGYALTAAFSSATWMTFLAAAPHLVIDIVGMSPARFGAALMPVPFAYMFGGFLTGRLTTRYGIDRMIAIGFVFAGIGASGFLVFGAWGELSALIVIAPMVPLALANALLQTNSIAGALSVNPKLAGAASGLVGFMQMACSAGFTLVLTRTANVALMPLSLVLAGLAAASFSAFILRGPRQLSEA